MTDETTEPTDEPTEPTEDEPTEPIQDDETAEPGETVDVQETDDEPVSEKEMEKAFKALGKVRELVARRVGDILGDDATQLIPCPTCADLAPGFVWPPHVAPLSPEATAGTLLLLGMQKPADLQPHPNAVLCAICQGAGQVETPSKVPGYDVVDCPECSATGRILTPTAPAVALVPQPGEPAPTVTGPTVMSDTLSPEAEAAKAQGYMVIPPYDPAALAPATG